MAIGRRRVFTGGWQSAFVGSAVSLDMTVDHLAPIRRLSSLAKLDAAAVSLLREACTDGMDVGPEKAVPLHYSQQPVLIVSGWAARMRQVANGSAVIADLALPGEIVRPIDAEAFKLRAIGRLRVSVLPDATTSLSLQQAYERSYQLTESYLLAQVARMALMSALERLKDLVAELLERSLLSSESSAEVFHLPLTQRHLGLALGLTSVHVNRTIRRLRESGALAVQRGAIRIPPDSLIGQHARRNVEEVWGDEQYPQRNPLAG